MEIRIVCESCGQELDGDIVRNELVVDLCEKCFTEQQEKEYNRGYEEGLKDGSEKMNKYFTYDREYNEFET